jgi:hypothetical protein
MTHNSDPGYHGLAPKPELAELLVETRLSPEAIAMKTFEVFDGYKLPNDKILHIEQRKDQKDGFVNDDKRNKKEEEAAGVIKETQFYIATPSVFNKEKNQATTARPILIHKPEWHLEADPKSPRDILHPLLGCLLTQDRKALRNRDSLFVPQTVEERIDKRPAVEALIAITLAKVNNETVSPEAYQAILEAFASYYGADPETLRENLDKLTAKSVEYVKALIKRA